MAACPDSEWEARGVDEWHDESAEGEVESEVTECSDGTSSVKEGETSCASENFATARVDDVT